MWVRGFSFTQGSHPAASESHPLPSKMLSPSVQGEAEWRMEIETGELSSPQPPPRHAPPPHIASFLGSLHSLLHPPVPLVILAPSEEGARCREGEAAARLT